MLNIELKFVIFGIKHEQITQGNNCSVFFFKMNDYHTWASLLFKKDCIVISSDLPFKEREPRI